jgi:hypothetical protein
MPNTKLRVLYIAGALSAPAAALAADREQQAAPWANAADESGRPANPLAAGAPPNAASRGAAVPSASSYSAQQSGTPTPHHEASKHASRSARTVDKANATDSKDTTTSRDTAPENGSAAAGGSRSSGQLPSDNSASSAGGSAAPKETREPASSSTTAERDVARNWSWLGILGLFGLLGLLGRRDDDRGADYVRRSDDADVRGVRAYDTPEPVARR